MSTWFVSRHQGASDWAAAQGITIDQQVTHLDLAAVSAGDVVIGILPIQMIASVCAMPAQYLHLVIDVPAQLRGAELSASQMHALGARIERYHVERVELTAPIGKAQP